MDYRALLEIIKDSISGYSYLFFIAGIFGAVASIWINRNKATRMDGLYKIIYMIIAVLILSFAIEISGDIQTITSNYSSTILTSTVTSTDTGGGTGIAAMGDAEVGFFEHGLIYILDFVAWSFNHVKSWILPETVELKDIILSSNENLFFDMHVNLTQSDGTILTVDLYKIMLSFVGAITFLIILNSFYRVYTSAKADDAEVELRELLPRLLRMTAKIIFAPLIIYYMSVFLGVIFNKLAGIDAPGYSDIKAYSAHDYGIGISFMKIYIVYIELKLFFVMLFRKVIINGFILLAPLAIAVDEVSDEFKSYTSWLSLLIKFMFLPAFYLLSFILAVIAINNFTDANALTAVFVYSFIFKIANTLAEIFTLQGASREQSEGVSYTGLMVTRAAGGAGRGASRSMSNGAKWAANSENRSKIGMTIGKAFTKSK